MGAVEFVLRYVEKRGLKLDEKAQKRLIGRYLKDRRNMDKESARQCLRIACDLIQAK